MVKLRAKGATMERPRNDLDDEDRLENGRRRVQRCAARRGALLVGVLHAHRLVGRDLEVVERLLRGRRLVLRVELHERDVRAARHQADVLQAHEPGREAINVEQFIFGIGAI